MVSLGLFIAVMLFIFGLFAQLLEFGGDKFSVNKVLNSNIIVHENLEFGQFNGPSQDSTPYSAIA